MLVLVAVVLAAILGAGVAAFGMPENPPRTTVTATADADEDRIALTHVGGETLDVTELTVRITIDGVELAHQPPVPFFAATGFESGPTGPFNSAADPRWTAGETAGVRLAGTNAPQLTPGAHVTVTIYAGDARIAAVDATA